MPRLSLVPPPAERAATRARLCAENGIDAEALPRHIAIILDGNGRWAQAHGMHRNEGHRQGEIQLWDVADGALDIGLPWMSVYVFSTENWRRPREEVKFLIWFNRDIMLSRRDEANAKGMRLRFIGRRGRPVPQSVRQTMEDTEALTRRNRRMTLTFCFNYGGRAEIVDAAKSIVAAAARGEVDPSRITERTIARYLYAPDMPDPDLLLRTSGEMRISNFLLWESAYAELMFPEAMWPDFGRQQLYESICAYQHRERRFGGVIE